MTSSTSAMSRKLIHRALIFLITLGLANVCLGQQTLHIAVASNFKSTLDTLAQRFTQSTQIPITISHGSSGQLLAQIQNGAPYDLYFSADRAKPERLEALGLVLHDHISPYRKTYAVGQLMLWAKDQPNHGLKNQLPPEPNAQQIHQYLKTQQLSKRANRVSIANPNTAPYGIAAKSFLQHIKLWSVLEPNIIRAQNVGQVFQHIQSNNSQTGLLALSQLRFANVNPAQYRAIPANLYPPIIQQVVVLKSAHLRPQAVRFYQWLDQESVRALIQQAGYSVPLM